MNFKNLIFFTKISLSLALMWFVTSRLDMSDSIGQISKISIYWSLIALTLFYLQLTISALRYKVFFDQLESPVPFLRCLDATLIGYFFSQTFISFIGGDAMRTYRMSQSGISVKTCIKAVILDRVSGLAGLITMLLFTLPFLLNHLPYETKIATIFCILITAVVVSIGIFILAKFPQFIPFKWLEFVSDLAKQIIVRMGTMYGFYSFIILSIIINSLNCLIFFIISIALSVNVSLLDMMILLQPVFFLSMLPISISGWGIREGAVVFALGLVGVSSSDSLSISILFGLMLILISLPGGVLWLFSKRQNPESTKLKST